MVDLVELRLGKTSTMVATKTQTNKSKAIVKAAETFLSFYLRKEAWSVSLIKEIIEIDNKVDILVPIFKEFINQYNSQKGKTFGAFQSDDVVKFCCSKLGVVYTNLVRYIFEVKIGLTPAVINELTNCWTQLHFPARNKKIGVAGVQLSDVNVAVCSINSRKKQPAIYFRGYNAHLCDVSGDVIFGSSGGQLPNKKLHGNLWLKDLWKMPGLKDEAVLCKNKNNVYHFKRSLAAKRRGATHTEFSAPNRYRLNIEDVYKFNLAMSCVRALRAKAIAEISNKQLDHFSGDRSKHELIANTKLAGDNNANVNQIISELKNSQKYFCEVGAPIVPECYVAFNVTAIPSVLQNEEFVTLKGVSSLCFPVAKLGLRRDRAAIASLPVVLKTYADFTNVVAVSQVNNKLVPQVVVEPYRVNADSFVFAQNGVLCDLSAVNPYFTSKNNNVG